MQLTVFDISLPSSTSNKAGAVDLNILRERSDEGLPLHASLQGTVTIRAGPKSNYHIEYQSKNEKKLEKLGKN